MKTVTVRGITFGSGIQKICIPVFGKTEDDVFSSVSKAASQPADLLEWRVDWYEQYNNRLDVLKVLKGIRTMLPEMPLLFTFRTAKEGGEAELSLKEYELLNEAVAESGLADLIDVEALIGSEKQNLDAGTCPSKRIIMAVKKHKVVTIASNHNFAGTPSKEEMIQRLCFMQELDADLIKLAVMPECAADVLSLMNATEEMYRCYADRPLITMSMGREGMLSRISGGLTGSCLTFGNALKASAPGQIPADALKELLMLMEHEV